jgi:hypothetical protein
MFPAGKDGSRSEGRHAERPEETRAVTGGGLSAAAFGQLAGYGPMSESERTLT